MSKNESNVSFFAIIGLLMLIVAPFGLATSCTTVEAGHVGVLKHFGAVKYTPLKEGIHFVRPFWTASVHEMDVKVQPGEAKATASSKDMQSVVTQVTVQFSVVGSMAPKVYQRFGDSEAVMRGVLAPAIQESVKSVTANYTAEELIKKRSEVKSNIVSQLHSFVNTTLDSRDSAGAVQIANVAITDFRFSKEFNASIEAKVKAEQDALKALNEKKKKITQAEADAAERKLRADATAYTTKVESEARAEAMRVEAEALKSQPQLIELRRVEKWDGKLPTYNGGGALPILNVK